MRPNWNVRKLWLQGERRHAILLHHAQESGMMAGYCMDYYLEWKAGMRQVNLGLARRAMREMKKLERVSRLMYRAGYLSLEALGKVISTNDQNRKELRENIKPEIYEIFFDEGL